MPIIGPQHTFNTDINEIKIVSLVPSITELLCHLGLENNIIACTKFCEHPLGIKSRAKIIGGTKNPRVKEITELKPDLIFANKEENTKEDVMALGSSCNVHLSDINTVDDFCAFVTEVGKLLRMENKASEFNLRLANVFANLRSQETKKVVYLIWKGPFMAAGKGTYINSVLEKCGFINLITESRYPEITWSEIQKLNPDSIFLSSEPYPFKMQDIREMAQTSDTDIKLVDGELFSWYSNRIFHLESHLNALRNH
jgi:ABC-type Fe3+-hydroxamate transport system substrate-binding protein